MSASIDFPRHHARRFVLVVTIIGLAPSGPVRAQQGDRELEARTHFAAGEYKEALDIYAVLYAQTLHPTYLRNIGRCYQDLDEPDKAISSFKEYLRKAPDLDDKQRAEIQRYIKEMEDLKRSRASAAEPPTTAPPPKIEPAPRLEAPPPATTEAPVGASLTATSAATESAAANAKDEPAFYGRWWFWTAVGIVAAGGVTAAVLLSRAPATPTAPTTLGTMPASP